MAFDHNTFVIVSYVAIMLVVGALGEMMQKLVAAKGGDQGWRGVYYVTKSYHPIFACALFFFLVEDVPLFEDVRNTTTNRLISGAGLGAFTMIMYELTVKTLRKLVLTFGDRLGGHFADWARQLGEARSSRAPSRCATDRTAADERAAEAEDSSAPSEDSDRSSNSGHGP